MKTRIALPLILVLLVFGNMLACSNTLTFHLEESFKDITALDVKGSFFAVDIVGHESGSLDFVGEIYSSKERDDIEIKYDVRGTTLFVWIERPNSVSNVSGKLMFKVPNDIKIKVDNSSGSVSLSNFSGTEIDLEASSGSVNARMVKGNLRATASSGSIKVSELKGDTHCQTSSGGIHVKQIKGNLHATSSSGSQSIFEIKGNVTSKASSGSVKINTVKGDIVAQTSSGSIRLSTIVGSVNLISSSGGQKGDIITLTSNSSFKSSSGSITMQLTNSLDELRFQLNAQSGSLQAKGMRGKKELEGGDGNILVKGKSSSGSQNYH